MKKKASKKRESNGLKKCPKCGERTGAPIFWGHPAPECMEEMEQGARGGRLVFGGCCISGNDPEWHCTKCGHEWGQRIQEIPERP